MELEEMSSLVKKEFVGRIYTTLNDFPRPKLIWEGDRLEDFLTLFKNCVNEIVYLREYVVPTDVDKDDLKPYIGKIMQLEVGVLSGVLFHVFEASATWLKDIKEEDEFEDSEHKGEEEEFINIVINEIDEIVNYVTSKATAAGGLKNEIECNEIVFDYVAEKHDAMFEQKYGKKVFLITRGKARRPERFGEEFATTLENVYDKAIDSLNKQFLSIIGERATACADWARNNGQKKLIQRDVELYLKEARVNVPKEYVRLLWTKAEKELKRIR